MGQPSDTVRIERRGDIAVLALEAPPGNLLGPRLRGALAEALDRAAADPLVAAVVLTGQGPHFSLGSDLRELGGGQSAPTPRDLADRIETLGKPVVAAIGGVAAGPALELALAAPARVAAPGAQVAMADLAFGLAPGAGGTQRLPRLVGAKAALDLLLGAQTVPASDMPGLFDILDADDLIGAAIAVARDCLATARPQTRDRRDGFDDPAGYQAEIARRRDDVAASPIPATRDVVSAVEAALLLPFPAGMTLEHEIFTDSVASPQSQALRHLVLAERRAANMPETRPGAARPIAVIGVVGGGATACAIARMGLTAGLRVIQFERTPQALSAAQQRLGQAVISQPGAGGEWQGTTALADLAQADLVIEAVADVARTKAQVFAALGQVARADAILATQSGLLPIDPIARAAQAPDRVMGLHFHGPVGASRLVEVIPGADTADWAVASAVALVRGPLGRVAVRAGTGGGTLPDRILAAARDAGLAMLALGVPIERIDRVIAQWGMPQGLFRQIDMLGLEPVLNRGRMTAAAPGAAAVHLDALARLVEAGRTGRAEGQGFYTWDAAGHAHADDGLGALLFGTAPAPMRLDEDEIRLRVVAAMANEGARMLRAGLALRPSDIDVACVLGAQFPRWRGGPMKAADLCGLFEVQRALQRLAETWPALYRPDPGFAALVKNGEGFDALNRVGKRRRAIPG